MEPSFWRARWREGRIGFHQPGATPALVRNQALFDGAERVLVPLCGKSVDLVQLAGEGRSVVGVELVEDAARAFFEEQRITPHRTQDGPLVRWEGGAIEIVVGDFFEMGEEELGRFDAWFDRAALVALPEPLRAKYVAHTRSLMRPAAKVLLVTFEHDAPKDAPPFAVDEREVRALFDGCAVTLVERTEAQAPSLTARGATRVDEIVFRIDLPA